MKQPRLDNLFFHKSNFVHMEYTILALFDYQID